MPNPLHNNPPHGNAYLLSPEMSEEQQTSYQQTCSQIMASHNMNASSGANIIYMPFNGPFNGTMHVSAAPNYGQHIGLQGYSGPMAQANAPAPSQQATQMVQPAAPVSTQADNPFETLTQQQNQQQPAANLAPSVYHATHVCAWSDDITQGPERVAQRELCNATCKRNKEYNCALVGLKVTQDSIADFMRGDERKAKKEFYRRAQKTFSQKKGRFAKAQAKGSDPVHQSSAATPLYLGAMRDLPAPNNNAGNFKRQQIPEVNNAYAADVQAIAQQAQQEMPPPHDTPNEFPGEEDFQQDVAYEEWLDYDLLDR